MKKTFKLKKALSIVFMYLCASFLATSVVAQTNSRHPRPGVVLSDAQKQEKRDSIINNADYIFRVGDDQTLRVFSDEKGQVYQVCKVQITEIYRGEQSLVNQYIYILRRVYAMSGSADANGNIYFEHTYSTDFPYYYNDALGGVFFCKKSSFNLSLINDKKFDYYNKGEKLTIDNNLTFAPISPVVEGLSNNVNDKNNYNGLYDLELEDFPAIRNFLKKYDNIVVPEQEKKSGSSLLKSGSENEVTEAQKDAFKLWMQAGRDFSKKSRLKSGSPVVDCEFFGDNQHIVYEGNKYYFVFDLAIKYTSTDVSTVYPDNVLLYFKYNSTAFGTNIVAQNKMTLTINDAIFDSTGYELSSMDHINNNDQALIRLSAKFENLGYYDGDYHFKAHRTPITVGGDKTKIGQVKIEFTADKLGSTVSISELWNQLDLNVNLWTESADCYSCFNFINSNKLTLNASYILGNVYIDNVKAVNGGNIIAGVGTQIEITGSGFMEYKKLGTNKSPYIAMKGDIVNDVHLDYTDIVEWSDSKIVCVVPSFVYANGNPSFRGTPVTGNIKVFNQIGQEGISTNPIYIKYSILNTYDQMATNANVGETAPTGKSPAFWARFNCNEQIKFALNISNINTTFTQAKLTELIEKAFVQWNRVLGFPFFVFDRDANGNIKTATVSNVSDSVNLISLEPNTGNYIGKIPANVLENYLKVCFFPATPAQKIYRRREIDMKLNPTEIGKTTNPYTEDEILIAIIHELGHGLGLGHVIEDQEIMYPNNQEGAIYTGISTNGENGAKYIFNKSKQMTWPSSTGCETLLSPSTCSPIVPINVKATATSTTDVTLEWEPSTVADSYTGQYSTSSTFTSPQSFTVTGITHSGIYNVTGLTAGTNYYFRIKSNNGTVSSAYSTAVQATTKTTTLKSSVQNLSVENIGTSEIKIQFADPATDETSIIIEKKQATSLKSLNDFTVIAVLGANTTKYFDYDVVDGVTYEYRIKYVTSTGVSSYSTSVTTTLGESTTHTIALPVSRNALLNNNTNPSLINSANTNYANYAEIRAWRWTHSGYPTYMRSLIDFDLSQIPQDAIIKEATLELKSAGQISNITENNTGYKSNASWLEVVMQAWNETQVTWNTQPSTSATYRVAIDNSTSRTQDYTVNITDLISKMVSDKTNTHGLMFRLQNDNLPYAQMYFGSQTNTNDALKPILKVKYITVPEKELQINPKKDAIVFKSEKPGSEACVNTYYGDNARISAEVWTNGGSLTYLRSLLDFDLSSIPSTAVVTDARLNLYSPNPQNTATDKHYSYLSTGSNSTYKSNASYLKRIVTPWDENHVTWNTQPQTISLNQISLNQSSSYLQDYLNIDIKNTLQDMVHKPDSAYGLMLMLQNETTYARMTFTSSDYSNVSIQPHLTVKYKVYPSLLKSNIEQSITKKNELNKNITSVASQREFIDSIPQVNRLIYPNPTNGNCSITYNATDDGIIKIEIFNSVGISIDNIELSEIGENIYTLNMSNYAKGIYLIHIKSRKGKEFIEKLVYN